MLQENVYNIDETGIMLPKLNSIKVLVGKDNKRGYRGVRVKRTTITAIWHYAYSDTGYTDSYISLQWLKLMFDPQTKDRANQKPVCCMLKARLEVVAESPAQWQHKATD